MREVAQLTNNRFLNINQVVDPENHVRGYQFAERAGVDSIAFICYDKNTLMVLLNKEYKPPIDAFILGAFGGSIDKDKSYEEIVQGEVLEEAGFEVSLEDIKNLGKVFVSTQMNQFCYLYLVYVDAKNQKDRHPENAIEAMAKTEWHHLVREKLFKELADWKAITILAKAERAGLIY